VAFPHGYFISAARFRFGQDSAKIRWSFVFSAVFGSTAVQKGMIGMQMGLSCWNLSWEENNEAGFTERNLPATLAV
jgi:hypothetical protein